MTTRPGRQKEKNKTSYATVNINMKSVKLRGRHVAFIVHVTHDMGSVLTAAVEAVTHHIDGILSTACDLSDS